MERSLVLFALTPRAGHRNHVYLVPENASALESLEMSRRLRVAESHKADSVLMVSKTVSQLTGRRDGREILYAEAPAFSSLPTDVRASLLNELEGYLDDLGFVVTEKIDWREQDSGLVVEVPAMQAWVDKLQTKISPFTSQSGLTKSRKSQNQIGKSRKIFMGVTVTVALMTLVLFFCQFLLPAHIGTNGREDGPENESNKDGRTALKRLLVECFPDHTQQFEAESGEDLLVDSMRQLFVHRNGSVGESNKSLENSLSAEASFLLLYLTISGKEELEKDLRDAHGKGELYSQGIPNESLTEDFIDALAEQAIQDWLRKLLPNLEFRPNGKLRFPDADNLDPVALRTVATKLDELGKMIASSDGEIGLTGSYGRFFAYLADIYKNRDVEAKRGDKAAIAMSDAISSAKALKESNMPEAAFFIADDKFLLDYVTQIFTSEEFSELIKSEGSETVANAARRLAQDEPELAMGFKKGFRSDRPDDKLPIAALEKWIEIANECKSLVIGESSSSELK